MSGKVKREPNDPCGNFKGKDNGESPWCKFCGFHEGEHVKREASK